MAVRRVYFRYCIYGSIFFALISNVAHTVCQSSSWILDDRHITQSWPSATIAWIEQHAPPASIKTALDALLSQEFIVAILINIYTRYYMSPEERDLLTQEGFVFLGGKLNIFEVTRIPGYVFKMAAPKNGHAELLNLGRIALADTLRDRVSSWNLQSFLTIPKKYAYIVPIIDTAYTNQPKVIVIAEKVPNYRKKRIMRVMIAKAWLKLKKVPDVRKCNMHYSRTGLALIDTEPWRTALLVPGFTHTPTVIPRPGTRTHTSDKCAYMPANNAHSPTHEHGFAGMWQCVTPQGLMVRSPYIRCITCWCKKGMR